MSWAHHRIEDYRHGALATWLERRMLEHANPVNFMLALLSTAGFVYGLWMHDWLWIVGSIAVATIGHQYCWNWKPKEPRDETADPPKSNAIRRDAWSRFWSGTVF